jgi:hypothetical protein
MFFWIQLAIHMAMFLMIIGSVFVMPVLFVMGDMPWYIFGPLETLSVNLIFSTLKDCALTKLENKVRVGLGWRPIGGFFGSYFVKPVKILFGVKRVESKRSPEQT